MDGVAFNPFTIKSLQCYVRRIASQEALMIGIVESDQKLKTSSDTGDTLGALSFRRASLQSEDQYALEFGFNLCLDQDAAAVEVAQPAHAQFSSLAIHPMWRSTIDSNGDAHCVALLRQTHNFGFEISGDGAEPSIYRYIFFVSMKDGSGMATY